MFLRYISYTLMLKKFRGLSLPDIFAFLLLIAIFVAFLVVGRYWAAPMQSVSPLNLSLSSLPYAALLSLSRVSIAFLICLVSSLSMGYWAAHSTAAEKIILPLVDIGQSVPVLGFLPGLVLTFVAIFPSNRVGLEIAATLTLFTGMGWNILLSFYGSIKTIPAEYGEITRAYGYGPMGRLLRLELPYATYGLVWNSMLSVAGGWFFLTVCESYTLGNTPYRLVGIGSYMALAAEKGDRIAIIAGVSLMLLLLIATDFLIWKPLLRWSRRFQKSIITGDEEEDDKVILFFARSERISGFFRKLRRRYADQLFVTRRKKRRAKVRSPWLQRLPYAIFLFLLLFSLWGSYQAIVLASKVPSTAWLELSLDTLYTFFRVMAVLLLSAFTMVPLGLWLGTRPHLVKRLQPILQIASAFPMPMVFPVFISIFVWLSIPISIGSVLLMMTGAQWFLLFNVISGVAGVPEHMVEVARLSGMGPLEIMRRVYLPGAFPQIVTGLISTVGGAWNTSIVAELVVFRGKEYFAPGIGTFIARAASEAHYPELVASVIVMVLVIVLINRSFWAKLYDLAQTRYRLDG